MNILYVSDSTTVSGAEIVLLNYLDQLTAPDYQTRVFLSRANTRLIKALDAKHIPYYPTDAYSRRIVRTTANPFALSHFAGSLYRTSREILNLIRTHDINLIHAISYPASLYCALPAKRARVPQVWHEHNIKRIHSINRHLYKWVASSCAFLVGPSDAVTGNLARAGIAPEKLRTIYNGIDLRKFSRIERDQDAVRRDLGLSSRQRMVGLFGQMLPYKGQMTLVRAAPDILRRHPDTAFLLVGARENPPYEAELERAMAAGGVRDAFRFTGWREDVQRIIQAMDVVVVATTTPEPAALALMETMAMARPIIASRTGGTPEIVKDGETGLLFPPGDPSALAERICRILDDPGFGERLGLAGRSRVERYYSLEEHMRTVRQLYAEATGRIDPAPPVRSASADS